MEIWRPRQAPVCFTRMVFRVCADDYQVWQTRVTSAGLSDTQPGITRLIQMLSECGVRMDDTVVVPRTKIVLQLVQYVGAVPSHWRSMLLPIGSDRYVLLVGRFLRNDAFHPGNLEIDHSRSAEFDGGQSGADQRRSGAATESRALFFVRQ